MNGLIKTAIAAIAATACLYGGTPAEPTKIISPAVFGKFCETGYPVFHKHVMPLADLISQGEGDWNAVNRGYAGDTPGGIQRLTGKTFENFTVGQVMDMQRRWLFAVGRYQFIPKTLRFAVANSDVSHLDMFTPETQNKLFAALLLHKRPTIGGYLTGKHNSINAALRALAMEWASVEYLGYGRGRGYYNHIGGNRAHITWREAAVVLKQVRESILSNK